MHERFIVLVNASKDFQFKMRWCLTQDQWMIVRSKSLTLHMTWNQRNLFHWADPLIHGRQPLPPPHPLPIKCCPNGRRTRLLIMHLDCSHYTWCCRIASALVLQSGRFVSEAGPDTCWHMVTSQGILGIYAYNIEYKECSTLTHVYIGKIFKYYLLH